VGNHQPTLKYNRNSASTSRLANCTEVYGDMKDNTSGPENVYDKTKIQKGTVTLASDQPAGSKISFSKPVATKNPSTNIYGANTAKASIASGISDGDRLSSMQRNR